MNRFKYISRVVPALGFCLFLGTSGCDQELDLSPQQSIDANEALRTSQGVESALIGAYSILQSGSLYGGDLNLTSELLGGTPSTISWAGSFATYRQISQRSITAENGIVTGTWITAYQAINAVNNVINAINVVDEARRERVLGEAHFIRGIMYFELVRLFGLPYEPGQTNSQLGVPIVLTPTTIITDENKVSRNTVEEVYAQAIADLTQAKNLLPESNGSRADTYAASAFLARVYLQQAGAGNNAAANQFLTKAAEEADRVISEGGFSLVPEYENEFNNSQNTSEDIFAIQQTVQSNAGSANAGLATFYSANERAEIEISPSFVASFEPGDERADVYFLSEDDILFNHKYEDYAANIPVVRLAEMYLIRAEANQRLGGAPIGGVTPVEDINTIRERADLDPVASVTLDDILRERSFELAFEGQALHDAKRLRRNVANQAYNSPRLVLPIPLREINANSNLVQNPGYTG
ncbi:RagB/SusD family nutrient uptake outer membrane protein [Sabulibacter ruber]|uniref:RagB/SusD family nutrient uptake outer membrane protein n=1 Tax=Sabulibacter ruber TaxID=2811901 RepID=UPI001A9760BA|nr:RagB/SusD family nutrient uptake outer membrane protein [Sabulibacter ruber]